MTLFDGHIHSGHRRLSTQGTGVWVAINNPLLRPIDQMSIAVVCSTSRQLPWLLGARGPGSIPDCVIPVTKDIKNKRPRGLDALLGHLLVKRIPVTYQLSSTKIPKYFPVKSKVDAR